MPPSLPPSKLNVTPVRVVGAAVAVGLHAAILAAIVSVPPGKIEMELPETVEIHFVELSDDVQDAAPNEHPSDEPASEPVEEALEEPEAEPVPEPEPEPIPEPEPEPEAITEPPPPPAPEPPPPPKPEPPPPPKPKPEPPKPKPAPPKPQPPKPRPEKPVSAPARPAPALAGPSGQESAPVARAPSAPVDPDRPRVVGKVDYLGKRPSPEYPRASQRRGEQGRVVVRVLISPEGRVVEATVQRSSGHSRLDESALRAVRTARFRPYMENGHAYRAMADIPFDFVL